MAKNNNFKNIEVKPEDINFDSMIFYKSWLDVLEGLPVEQRDEGLLAICKYAFRGEVPTQFSSPMLKMFFDMARPLVEANIKTKLASQRAINARWGNKDKQGKKEKSEKSEKKDKTEAPEKAEEQEKQEAKEKPKDKKEEPHKKTYKQSFDKREPTAEEKAVQKEAVEKAYQETETNFVPDMQAMLYEEEPWAYFYERNDVCEGLYDRSQEYGKKIGKDIDYNQYRNNFIMNYFRIQGRL